MNNETQLKNTILQKEQVISYQEKMINELKNKMAEKASVEAKERKNILEDLNKQKEMYQDIEDKYKTLLAHANIEEKRKNERMKATEKSDNSLAKGMRGSLRQYHLEIQENGSQNLSIDPANDIPKVPKKVYTVKRDEVKNIGFELNMRFRLKGLPLNDAISVSYLLTLSSSLQIEWRIKEALPSKIWLVFCLCFHLSLFSEPFCLESEEYAQLLARYLVEDNDQETVELNFNQTNNIAVIKSIFKQVVGEYHLLNPNEEKTINAEVIQVLFLSISENHKVP